MKLVLCFFREGCDIAMVANMVQNGKEVNDDDSGQSTYKVVSVKTATAIFNFTSTQFNTHSIFQLLIM